MSKKKKSKATKIAEAKIKESLQKGFKPFVGAPNDDANRAAIIEMTKRIIYRGSAS
jgi:hypothetical protein